MAKIRMENYLRRQFAAESHGDNVEKLIWIDRFEQKWRQIAAGQALHRFLDLIRRQAGKQDDGKVLLVLLNITQNSKTVGAGHLEIEKQKIGEPLLLEKKNGGFAVVRFVHLIAGLSQQMCKRLALDGRIVCQQDPRFRLIRRRG